jgi:hypothetical protein
MIRNSVTLRYCTRVAMRLCAEIDQVQTGVNYRETGKIFFPRVIDAWVQTVVFKIGTAVISWRKKLAVASLSLRQKERSSSGNEMRAKYGVYRRIDGSLFNANRISVPYMVRKCIRVPPTVRELFGPFLNR